MRKLILITGTAIILSAAPANAGALGGLLGGAAAPDSQMRTNSTPTHRSTGSEVHSAGVGGCLCNAAGSLLGRGSSMAGGAHGLTSSVIGLGALTRGHGGHGGGQAIGLAGVVSGSVRTATSLNASGGHGRSIGLAGSVTGTVRSAVAGSYGHGSGQGTGSVTRVANVTILNGTGAGGRALVNASALNRVGGTSGKLVNASILNGRGTAGRSAVNVAALNGSGGTAGKIVNVSVLNRSGTTGRSLVGVAALNGSAGGSGKLVNLALLNGRHSAGGAGGGSGGGHHGGLGLPNGVQLINGVLCGPDGVPLAPGVAAAVMASIGGKHGGGSSTSGNSGGGSSTPGGSAGSPSTGSGQAPRATPPQRGTSTPTPTSATPIAFGERHPQVRH